MLPLLVHPSPLSPSTTGAVNALPESPEPSVALILLVDRDLCTVIANGPFLASSKKGLHGAIHTLFDDIETGGVDKTWLTEIFAYTGAGPLAHRVFDRALTMPDGSERIIRVTASPIQDEHGRVTHILFQGVDEGERRSFQMQLLDAARLAMVGQMATGMAHEINQPLAVLQFAVEELIDWIHGQEHRDNPDGFGTRATALISVMEDQIQRASGLVRSMQTFAHRSGKAIQKIDVASAIAQSLSLVEEQMRLADIQVQLAPVADLPPVLGSGSRLQQVLINLILNARDSIKEAEAPNGTAKRDGRIEISAQHDKLGGKVVIDVGDNGTGIVEHVRERMFEPFFTTKRTGSGSGLGLSISSEILREMHGAIAASNRAQGGASFRITLPATA